MQPLILFSEIGKRWYVVTRYTSRPNGVIVASKKYDVTDQMEHILCPNPGPDVPDEVIDEIDQSLMDR